MGGRVIAFPISYRGRNTVSETNRPLAYALNEDRTLRPCTIAEWAQNFESEKGGTPVKVDNVGRVRISTVFFGVDTAMAGPPAVFETMIFGGAHDRWQTKSSSWAEAEQTHAAALAMVQQGERQNG